MRRALIKSQHYRANIIKWKYVSPSRPSFPVVLLHYIPGEISCRLSPPPFRRDGSVRILSSNSRSGLCASENVSVGHGPRHPCPLYTRLYKLRQQCPLFSNIPYNTEIVMPLLQKRLYIQRFWCPLHATLYRLRHSCLLHCTLQRH